MGVVGHPQTGAACHVLRSAPSPTSVDSVTPMVSPGKPRPNGARFHRAGVFAVVVAAGLSLSGCKSSSSTADTEAPATSTGAAVSQQTTDPVRSRTTSSKVAAAPAKSAPPAAGRTKATSLTCNDVKQAFLVANVAVSSIEDDTAGTQDAAKQGTLPYAITMHCVVRLPGVRLPQHVQLDRTPGKSTKLVTALGSVGPGTRLPAAQGYGDVGYLLPQGNGSYALLAGKGDWILDIGDLRHADDDKHIAHYLLGRL